MHSSRHHGSINDETQDIHVRVPTHPSVGRTHHQRISSGELEGDLEGPREGPEKGGGEFASKARSGHMMGILKYDRRLMLSTKIIHTGIKMHSSD
jgi:hypothetical protein